MHMKLSKQERLILYNQYQILMSINSNSFMTETYNNYQEILLKGYTSEYHNLMNIFEDELSEDVTGLVWDVFNMYRNLKSSYRQLSVDEKEEIIIDDVTFQGYDEYNEYPYFEYARFILFDLKHCEEIYDDGKVVLYSSKRMINTYEYMVETWKGIQGPRLLDKKMEVLTFDQMKDIIESGYRCAI